MKPFVLIAGTLVCLVTNSVFAELADKKPEAVEIPLKDIWAYGMSAARDLSTIEDQNQAKLVKAIRRDLSKTPPNKGEAGAGFVVEGQGLNALRGAHAVLVEGAPSKVTKDNEASIVFYSYESGLYVQLQSVSRRGNTVEVRYRFVPHKTLEVTEHFALIPIGKLPPGTFQVNFVQVPIDEQLSQFGWTAKKIEAVNRAVCKSFSFVVQ